MLLSNSAARLTMLAPLAFFAIACSQGNESIVSRDDASTSAAGKIESKDVKLKSRAPLRMADNGDGTYTNPPLYGDFPDPSVIRVDDTFYFATTTFANVPGLTILESKDLVNWRYVSHVMPRLEGRAEYDLEDGGSYRHGVYAPSLRYHDRTYYIAVTPVGLNTRIYHSQEIDGSWDYFELDRQAFDPALYFEDDGTPYMATAIGSDGTVELLTLTDDLSGVVASQEIMFNEGAEGSKIVKRGDYYYMFHSIPRRLGMTVARAKSLFGPWEVKNQIDDTTGGHQGAIVDLPDGTDYGFVMVDAGSIGRMTNISPIHWVDGWPVWGDEDAPGRVPAAAEKPIKGFAAEMPATSDEFDDDKLGMQWQWNHNPIDDRWSLSERPGFLRLRPTTSDDFWNARNTLTQKTWGPYSSADVKFDVRNMAEGDRCGFGTLGKYSANITIVGDENGRHTLDMHVIESTEDGPIVETRVSGVDAFADFIYLRTEADFETDEGALFYSFDAENWTQLGGAVPLAFDWRTGTFQGEQFAIFCFNAEPSEGYVDIDSFVMSGR